MCGRSLTSRQICIGMQHPNITDFLEDPALWRPKMEAILGANAKTNETDVCLRCVFRFRMLAAWRNCTPSPLPSPSLSKRNLSAAPRVSSDVDAACA